MKQYIIATVIFAVSAIALFVIVQLLIVRFNGTPVAVPDIARGAQTSGSGPSLSYAVMGDSTAISQGSDYSDGFAAASIAHLGQKFSVKSINTGISGATTADIRNLQLDEVLRFKPDIVLLAAGANDATHFTSSETTRESVQYIVDALKRANPEVKIVVTGTPAMDSVSRFPIATKPLMRLRTQQVNAVFQQLISKNGLILAPVAQQTRDDFLADPTLTASDNFHPNARGYALWTPVITQALDSAIEQHMTRKQ